MAGELVGMEVTVVQTETWVAREAREAQVGWVMGAEEKVSAAGATVAMEEAATAMASAHVGCASEASAHVDYASAASAHVGCASEASAHAGSACVNCQPHRRAQACLR